MWVEKGKRGWTFYVIETDEVAAVGEGKARGKGTGFGRFSRAFHNNQRPFAYRFVRADLKNMLSALENI